MGWVLAVLVQYFDLQASGEVSWTAVLLWPSVAYWGVSMFEEWVLNTWLQSKEMSLSALTVLIVVLLGGEIAGVLGLLVAVPITACIQLVLAEVVLPRLRSWAERN